jgi:hypothetical protein
VAHQFAVRFAWIAFATAAVQGLAGGADFEAALKISLFVLVVFYALGYICGEIARRLVEEHTQLEIARQAVADSTNNPAPQT